MRIHSHGASSILVAALALATSCVEPPPAIVSPDNMDMESSDLGTDTPRPDTDASTQDMKEEVPEGAYIRVNGQIGKANVVMEAYSNLTLDIELVDEQGNTIEATSLMAGYLADTGDHPIYNAPTTTLKSTTESTGVITLKSEQPEAEFELTYEVRPYAPRYNIPRVIHAPYTEKLRFEDLLRVTPSGPDNMSLHAWFGQLQEDRFKYSFEEVDDRGNRSGRALDGTIEDGNPQRHDYVLTFERLPGGESIPPFAVTIFTHEPNSMSSGLTHHCKVVDREVSCWGTNEVGQLGTSDNLDKLSSTPLQTGIEFFAVDAGTAHNCALAADRQVYCWGANHAGQSHREDQDLTLLSPAAITPPERIFSPAYYERSADPVTFTQVTAGSAHSCALSTRGIVYCWGDDTYGQLGYGPDWKPNTPVSNETFLPIELAADTRFQKVSAGFDHTCALSFDGEVFCWGANTRKQSSSSNSSIVLPTLVSMPNNAPALDLWTGPDTTCARIDQDSDFGVYCWGDNNHNKIVQGNDTSRISPPQKMNYYSPGATPRPVILDLALGQRHGCALSKQTLSGTDEVKLHCWGLGEAGELGRGDSSARIDQPPSVFATDQAESAKWTDPPSLDLSLMSNSTCLLDRSTGKTSCWGEQLRGVLGDNASAIRPPPSAQTQYTRIENYPTSFDQYSSIPAHIKPALTLKSTCLLIPEQNWTDARTSLEPRCWGSNAYGQLGQNRVSLASTFDLSSSVNQNIDASPFGLAASTYQACAIKQDNSKQWCWGRNRRSLTHAKVLTAENKFIISSPDEYSNHNNRDRVAMSTHNTCSWSKDNSDEPPICRGSERYGALGNAVSTDFTNAWTGLDDERDVIGDFMLENRYFDPDGTFDLNNRDTITHLELGDRTGCMIRKSESTVLDTDPAQHTYTLWCWGDVERAWGLPNDPSWGAKIDYEQNDGDSVKNAEFRSYLPRIVWTGQSAEPPRALTLARLFGCLVDHDGALICWGSPPLRGDATMNTVVSEPGAMDEDMPFEKPVKLLEGFEFWNMSGSLATACLQHARRDMLDMLEGDAKLTCFGRNDEGQAGQVGPGGTIIDDFIGNPLQNSELETVQLGGLDELHQFTVGDTHVCVTGRFEQGGDPTPTHAIEMACWGLDTHGQSRIDKSVASNYSGYVHTAALPSQ